MLLGGQHSGVEQAIVGLLKALPRFGPQHQYLLVCRKEYEPFSPVPTKTAPRWAKGRLLRIVYEQIRLAHDLQGQCDLLHAPGYIMPLNWPGPAVLTVYDVIALQFPHLCKPSNAWHYRIMLPRSLRKAQAVIVPSFTVAQDVRHIVPEAAEKLHVIPLGIEESYQPATEAEITHVRAKYQLPELYLLCVGNIEPKKNLPAVLKAFDEAAATIPHHLVIAGRRGWRAEPFYRALAAMRHRQRVHWLGYVSAEDLTGLYSGAALLIQWALYEGMGLPPLEAMACGTPVLISDGGALPEIAGPAAEIVSLGAPEKLAGALVRLLQDEARLKELREKGLRHAAQYTWERHARAVLALYEELCYAQG